MKALLDRICLALAAAIAMATVAAMFALVWGTGAV